MPNAVLATPKRYPHHKALEFAAHYMGTLGCGHARKLTDAWPCPECREWWERELSSTLKRLITLGDARAQGRKESQAKSVKKPVGRSVAGSVGQPASKRARPQARSHAKTDRKRGR